MAPSARLRRIAIRRSHLLIAAGLLAAVAYSGWWWLTARSLQARIDGWAAQERAAGALITPDRFAVGGFPLAFSVAADAVLLKWPKGFGLASAHLEVAARPWSPFRFNVVATHGFSVALPPGTERPTLVIAGETLRGTVGFDGGALPADLNLTADSVSATQGGGDGNGGDRKPETLIATFELSGARPAKPPAADNDVGLDFTIHAIDISADALDQHPLGSTIADTALRGQIMGPLPASADAAGFRAWRDAGGSIEISDFELRWGPLAMSAKGTAALDPDMQPEGAFTAHIAGWEKTIDTLAAAGWIKPGPASLAKLALGVTSRPDANGQPAVDTPVTIQSRRISVGPLKLGEIPELRLD